jgi:diguanylate cyclase (GGDEF)-like protein/PAS domain S-box-containing protein
VFLYHVESDKIIDCNPAFYKLLNLTSQEVLNKSIFALLGDSFSKRYEKIFKYSYKTNKLKSGKIRLFIKNSLGIEIPVEASITYIKNKGETLMLGIMRDLTFAIQAVEEHKKYLQTLSLLQLHVIELDEKLNVLYINYIPNSKFPNLNKNSSFLEVILEDYREYVKTVLENVFKTKKSIRIRFPIKISKSRNDWYEADFVLIRTKKKRYIRGIIKDITLEYISEKQFILLSEHDLLTSLPNRNRLEEDLYKAILRADKNRTLIAVGFLDLDKFFHVNELLGHRFGDLVLSLFSEKLQQIPEINNTLYRWGGDQFVFFVENIKNKSDIHDLLEKLRRLAKEPIMIEGEKYFITFSIGISIYPIDGMTIDTLFGEADKAMNFAKQNGRFQFVFASNLPRKDTTISKFEIQSHILESISENKILPYFQPIYEIRTNRIAGMEALARLANYRGGIYIGPDIFIPLAEDLGLIEELSYYIIKKSLEFYKKVHEKYGIYLSINISRRALHSDLFIMNMFDLQRELGINPKGVIIEVTESLAFLDKDSSLKKLYQLREMGYRIAIDDFGTGYSSLGELQELPIDLIKIDKIFVRRLKSEDYNRILDAIVLLAQNLNLEIIAEGVEDLETLKKLDNIGIKYAQGFFYAPPLTEEDFVKRIENEEIKNYHYFS